VGETRVDLQHLLEDIRDAYPGALEETILTEIVANSLDSRATCLRIDADPGEATLTVVDDGSGMARRELARYHDIATTTKIRGEGIGFAGIGIKLGILASEEVLTEARRGKSHVATSWWLVSRHRAPWRWVPVPGLVGEHGTAVRLRLHNRLSPLLETGFLESTLLRHYQPLFDPEFDEILAEHYPAGVRFIINGRVIARVSTPEGRALLAIRPGRKRKPSGHGYLVRQEGPLPEEQQGIAISTLGKVIKRGWDWLGFSPVEPRRIAGLIEVPVLAACLTLNKADFIRAGTRGGLYLAYRKAIQEAVSEQLATWGDRRDALEEELRRRKTRPLERDLAAVLAEMAKEFPLIASLVEQHFGGQRRLPMSHVGGDGAARGLRAAPLAGAPVPEAVDSGGIEALDEAAAESASRSDQSTNLTPAGSGTLWPTARGRHRPTRLGLTIQFESRPDDPNLARLVESTVWVNEAHPAYRRAVASRAEGYHVALSVAMALAPLAAEPAGAHGFVTAFLACWGEASGKPVGSRGSR
jgi:hypothetical protein